MRKLFDRKIVGQNGTGNICKEKFANYSDIVPDHINPISMGGRRRTIILTIFRRSTGGAMGRRAR
jgi:hypothetical protein